MAGIRHVVVPSLPGFGFSTPLTKTGVSVWQTADLWLRLMRDELGYDRFGAQGGDWRHWVSAQLGHKYPEHLIGIHLTIAVPMDFATAGIATEADYADDEKGNFAHTQRQMAHATSHGVVQGLEPQTLSHGLHDSAADLLAWLLDRRKWWGDSYGDVERVFTKDELVTLATLYWVTDSFVTSARYYWESQRDVWRPSHDRQPVVEAPTGIAVFPGELIIQPRPDGGLLQPQAPHQHESWRPLRSGGAARGTGLGHPRVLPSAERYHQMSITDQPDAAELIDPAEFAYDHNGPENAADRPAAHRRIVEKCPVVHSPAYGGYYVAVGYDEVSNVLRRALEYSSAKTVTIPETPMPSGMVQFDPPKVHQWRKALGPYFTSAGAEEVHEATRALVAAHVDRFARVGRVDLVDGLVQPVPAISTLEALGLPLERFSRYIDLFHRVNKINPLHDDPDVSAAIEADVADLLADVQGGGEPAVRQAAG